MIRVYPFTAMHPANKFATAVVCGEKTENHEDYHYEQVVKPFLGAQSGRPADYTAALNYFSELNQKGVLLKESEPAVYIYKQTQSDGSEFEGLILGISSEDYEQGLICRHENTLTEKQELMVQHISALRVVGEPVLLADPIEDFIIDWMEMHDRKEAMLNFTDQAGNRHQVWAVTDVEAIAELRRSFELTSRLYIADGHHRIAAGSLFLERMREKQDWPSEKCIIMACVLPESRLMIKPFHRLLNGTDTEDWLDMIHNASSDFYVDMLPGPALPEKKGDIVALTPAGWYRLRLKPGHMNPNPAENLDVFRLEKYVFQRYFHIKDSKTDPRLTFVRGDKPLEELEFLRNNGSLDGAFILYPNTMREIKEVADASETMPPKSTWIEPKIPGGMLIQQF